jgi:hypothetical protein
MYCVARGAGKFKLPESLAVRFPSLKPQK